MQAEPAFTPSCTVVICTKDRPELLDRCLASIAQLNYQNFDVLVVDNAPKDSRSQQVAARWRSHYVVEPVVGLSRARNRGASECSAELIAYIDDDAVAEPGWLAALAREFADPRVMAVAGTILPLNEPTTGPLSSGDSGASRRFAVDSDTLDWFEIANLGGIGSGGNMAVRRSAFGPWPGFDVRLGRGQLMNTGEDDYAFFSLIDRGFRVAYTSDAKVFHRTQSINLVDVAAYVIFLWFDQPKYRRKMLKLIKRSIASSPHAGRVSGSHSGQTSPRLQKIAAAFRGLLHYMRFRLANV